MNKRKGSITYFIIALVLAMLILIVGLTRRMRSHTQLLTLTDYTQISRYFLESYVGDVLQHIRNDSNNPAKKIYTQLRNDNSNDTDIDLSEYNLSKPLKDIESGKYLLKYDGIVLTDDIKIKPLSHKAKIVKVDNMKSNAFTYGKVKERKGIIKITCKCKFREKTYTMQVSAQYTVVYRMLPVLKDFILFCTNIGAEQQKEIGYGDNINICKTENGNQKDLRPIILLPPLSGTNEVKTTGRVYLGPINKKIYLNLAGEPENPNSPDAGNAGEMDGMITSYDVGILRSQTLDDTINFTRQVVLNRVMPTIDLRLKKENGKLDEVNKVKMCVMGFSKEAADFYGVQDTRKHTMEGFLDSCPTHYPAEYMPPAKPGRFWTELKNSPNTKEYISKASGLKLLGLSSKNINDITQRDIYGKIYARFFVFSFWKHPQTIATPDTPLPFNMNNDIRTSIPQIPRATTGRNDETLYIQFSKIGDSGDNVQYHQVMSKIMSDYDAGGAAGGANSNKVTEMSINRDKSGNRTEPLNILYPKDFKDENDLKVSDNNCFDKYGDNYLKIDIGNNSENAKKTIQERIGRYFNDETEFKKETGLNEANNKSFQINGVVYVKGNLTINELDKVKNKNIGGGIIIVDGKITLGNVTRTQEVYKNGKFSLSDGDPSSAETAFKHWVDDSSGNPDEFRINQDKMLTFVSLSNSDDAITVTGNTVIGVQLVCLNGGIKWKPSRSDREIVFLGGIACKNLNLQENLKTFKDSINDSCRCKVLNAPFFMYHPEMATSTPSLAVQIPQSLTSYKLSSEDEGTN